MIIDIGARHLIDQVLVLVAADLLGCKGVSDRVCDPAGRALTARSSADPHTLEFSQQVLGPNDPMQIAFVTSQDEIENRDWEADAGVGHDPREQFHRSVGEAGLVGGIEDRRDTRPLRLLDQPMGKHGPCRDLAVSALGQPPRR